MKTVDDFRIKLIADYTSQAVRKADKISKKIAYLEFDGLFRVKGEYVQLCQKGTAFPEIVDIPLSPDASKWIYDEVDQMHWKIGYYLISKINELYDTDLLMFEDWEFARFEDDEAICVNFILSVKMDDPVWIALDENTQREIRIIFDAIDNSKYFLHSIDSYFYSESLQQEVDVDYKNHLKARL
ncbi:MAG: hypothetical protein N2319_09900 [Candidatus Kapabacteria bacterium]|nr:hypothetical protein [Candidatus Kapabacteria bacterium]